MSLYQRVAYITPDGTIPVAPRTGAGGSLGGGLFVPIGAFTYNTYAGPGVFDIDRQGLLSLLAYDATSPWGVYSDAGNRIVTKADGTMDVMPFMQAIAELCSYGTDDESLTYAGLLTAGKSRNLRMRCGPTTAFLRQAAGGLGIVSRQVHLLNVTEPNGFDDGHVLCEAKIGGAWKLFDVPNDTAWSDTSGTLLSLKDVIAAGAGNCVPVKLAEPKCAASVAWAKSLYDQQLRTASLRQAWCERIYEIPGMATPSGGICWGVPASLLAYASQIANYPGTFGTWTTMPFDQWVQTYY